MVVRPLRAVLMGALFCVAGFGVSGAVEASYDDQVGLPHNVVEDAEAWQAFVTHAGAVNAAFASGQQVRAALKTGAGYEPGQLEQGEIAYAALVALQQADFVAGLRRIADDPAQNQALAQRLMGDPSSVYSLPGAEEAAGLATARIQEQARHLAQVGAEVKQSAYDVQHSSWSQVRDSDRRARLALVKKISATRFVAKPQDGETLRKVMADLSQAPDPDFTRREGSPVVTRALVLAALAVLRRTDDPRVVRTVLYEPDTQRCFNWAKLALYECLAVAGPRYEDIFCLAEHGLKETATCVSASTHASWKSASWEASRTAALTPPAPVAATIVRAHGRRLVRHSTAHSSHRRRRGQAHRLP
ncbi:MAG TPA: hypothetical protein VG407_18165 [Caulobacteraceae bacterium]|jgi:hypothetical protein|nr:hypothetical protein [Caulobacteraceae bacterium]